MYVCVCVCAHELPPRTAKKSRAERDLLQRSPNILNNSEKWQKTSTIVRSMFGNLGSFTSTSERLGNLKMWASGQCIVMPHLWVRKGTLVGQSKIDDDDDDDDDDDGWWKICQVFQGCYSWSVFGCSEFNSFVNVHDTLCDSAVFAGISLYVYVMFGLPSLSNMFCLLCTRRPTVEEIGKHTKQLTPREDGSLATRKSFLRTQYLQRCNDLITTSSLQIAEAHSKPYSR